MSGAKKKETCPVCGKKIIALRKHIKRNHPETYNQTIGNKAANPGQNSNFVEIKEVKLMADKKPKETVETDTCGGCNEQIPTGSKFCPKCGVEFE